MTNGQHNDDLLSAYHDGELTTADRDRAERLLDESPDARAELDDYRMIARALSDMPRDAAPAGLCDDVLREIRALPQSARSVPAAGKSPRKHRVKHALLILAGGLTTAAAVVLAVNLGGRDAQPAAGDGNAVAMSDPSEGAAMEDLGLDEEVAADPPTDVESNPATGMTMAARGASGAALPDTATSDDVRLLPDSARPPEDALPGDIYRYIDYSGDDGVVVVDATVIDVQEAIGRVQYLLTTNKIRTVPVTKSESMPALAERSKTVDNESGPGGAGGTDWGIYIETDADQFDAALQALNSAAVDNKDVFVNLEVAGVIDEPPPTTREYPREEGGEGGDTLSDQADGAETDSLMMKSTERPKPDSNTVLDASSSAKPGSAAKSSSVGSSAGAKPHAAGSRASVPSLGRQDGERPPMEKVENSSRANRRASSGKAEPAASAPEGAMQREPADAVEESAPEAPGKSPRESLKESAPPPTVDTPGMPAADRHDDSSRFGGMEPESAPRAVLTNGYQQVVNFSNPELRKKLRKDADFDRKTEYYSDNAGLGGKGVAEELKRSQPDKEVVEENRQPGRNQAGQAQRSMHENDDATKKLTEAENRDSRRTVRLLLILEPTQAAKLKSDLRALPVEATRP